MNLHALHRRLPLVLVGAVSVITAPAAAAERWVPATQEVTQLLKSPADPARGKELFVQCAGCHIASIQTLPKGWVPEILGQHPRYLAKELIDFSRGVRWDVRMQPIAREHARPGGQDVLDVVTYISRQSPDRAGGGAPQTPVPARAAGAYYSSSCSGCHGPTGEGEDAGFVPRLAGQDSAYLLRQLHDVVDGRRPNMRAQHLQLLTDRNARQLDGLAAYLSQLPPAVSH